MLRTTTLSAAALLGLTLLAPPTAQAAGQTCRGEAATIEGTPGQVVSGTEGRDVVVTNGAATVETLGGDDLVCVTGTSATSVRAGAGNDVVDATSVASAYTVLGAGDDVYTGSSATDRVVAGSDETTDSGHDVVDTGAGATDQVSSGTRGQPNPDRVTGGVMILSWLGSPTATSAAVADAGSFFQIAYPNDMSTLAIDTRAGTLSTGAGPSLELRGFADFSVRSDRFLDRFTFRGTDVDESVRLWNTGPQTRTRVALAGGDDLVTVVRFARGSRFNGGSGLDRITTGAPAKAVLDLGRERLEVGTGARTTRAEAASFEGATVAARRVVLAGTAGPDEIDVNACRATVEGRGGRDRVTALGNTVDDVRIACRDGRRMRFDGGAGNDKLVGGPGRDLLDGGPGHDRAEGGAGRDTCRAEVRRSCEVRR